MSKKFFFIAGLPRSGSTLLSALLNQNPKFYSGPSSPVLSSMYIMEEHLKNDELFNAFPKPNQASELISSIPFHYYSDIKQPIIFDKNRAWPAKINYIEGYINQKAKIICPVRDIDEILTSFILMLRRNPYREGQERINFIDEQLVKLNIPITDDNRCEQVAGPDGILGQSLSAIMKAFEDGYSDNLHFVEYKKLVSNPEETLKKIYNFIEEEYFIHKFTDIKKPYKEKDLETYGLFDMHEVRPKIKDISADPKDVLSEKTLKKCFGMDIWRKGTLNKKN